MASYSIVLAPIAALLAVDFFIVKRQRLDIYELYRPDGIYRFAKGWNWRAYVALLCGFAPNLPGMIAACVPFLFMVIMERNIHFRAYFPWRSESPKSLWVCGCICSYDAYGKAADSDTFSGSTRACKLEGSNGSI